MTGLGLAAGAAKVGNRVLDVVVALLLLLLLFYSAFGLWDTLQVMRGGSSDALLRYKPAHNDPEGLAWSFSELRKINEDVCAWLTVDNTKIDYPVVQGESNFEYLNKTADLRFALSGSIFLDYRNKSDFSDPYSLVYGHHVSGGAMFGEVEKFLDKRFFNDHETGTLFLPDCEIPIRFFACVSTRAQDQMYFSPMSVQTPEQMQEFVAKVQAEAACTRPEAFPDKTGKIIALSTCSNANLDGRYILFGTLLDPRETTGPESEYKVPGAAKTDESGS